MSRVGLLVNKMALLVSHKPYPIRNYKYFGNFMIHVGKTYAKRKEHGQPDFVYFTCINNSEFIGKKIPPTCLH